MSFTTDAFIIKPDGDQFSLCLSGTVHSQDVRLALRVNGELVPAEFRAFEVPDSKKHPCYGRSVRITLRQIPEHIEILEDGVIAFSSRKKDLKVFPGISFSLSPSPAKEGIYVYGWCFFDGSTPVSVEVLDENRNPVPVFRSSLPNLENQYALKDIRPGFSFALSRPGGVLIFSWKEQRREIDLKPYMKKSLTSTGKRKLYQGLAYLRRNGFSALVEKSRNPRPKTAVPEGYQAWLNRQSPDAAELEIQKQTSFAHACKITLLCPLHTPDAAALQEMLASVENQSYGDWEMWLTYLETDAVSAEAARNWHDHPKIHFKKLSRNLGHAYALNEALAMSEGNYIGLMGQEDFLTPDALYEMVRVLQAGRYQAAYSDEDQFNDLTRTCQNPFFKPDYSPDLLHGCNYIGSLLLIDQQLAKTLAGFMAQYEGAEVYDLVLRISEETDAISHIPKVLYHRRIRPQQTLVPLYQSEACARAMTSHMERTGQRASVTVMPAPWSMCLQVQTRLRHKPLISVISLTKDPERLEQLLQKLRQDGYGHYEVISPNPSGPDLHPAAAVNAALPQAHGQLILLLQENTLPADVQTLESMAARLQMPGTSMVAGRLLNDKKTVRALGEVYENGRIHARFAGLSKNEAGYYNLAQMTANTSLAPFDGIMFYKKELLAHGGLDTSLRSAAMADFCLSLSGRIAATPRVSFISEYPLEYDSLDLELLQYRHPRIVRPDPYYSQAFAGQKEVYDTRFA